VKNGRIDAGADLGADGPSPATGVIALAAGLGYTVTPRRITRDDLYMPTGLFTGTAAEVTPIREVDGRR